MIEVSSLSVTLGRKQIVQDVSFSADSGQWLMLAGPNGAGKTSVVNAISQSIPYTGSVSVDGVSLRGMKSRVLARKIGVLAQNRPLSYAFTAEEIVRLGCYSHRSSFFSSPEADSEALFKSAVRSTGIEDFLARPVTTLSGGEVQRVFLAQLFAQDPQILILDEPANHLDLPFQKQIFELTDAWRKQGKRTVISVVHDLSMAKLYGTHALLLSKGRAAAFGKAEDVLTEENLSTVYGINITQWMKKIYELW